MVIYSTLIDAATEHVEIFGKAGSTTIREIKIDNPQDSTIVLFIEKVSFTIKNHGDQGSMDSWVRDSWTFIGPVQNKFRSKKSIIVSGSTWPLKSRKRSTGSQLGTPGRISLTN